MSAAIIIGRADSTPPNTSPSTLTDTNPTVGLLINAVAGNRLEMLDGAASGEIFIIIFVDVLNNRYRVAENLFAEGVLSGESGVVLS